MNYKRQLYILLGIVSLLLPVIVCSLICNKNLITYSIMFSILTYLLYLFLPVAIDLVNGEDNEYFDILPFTNMIFTLNRKKIYHSDLGYFYIYVNKYSDIILYEQKVFYTKRLFDFHYRENMDENRKIIKAKLDSEYSSVIRSKKIKNEISKWDGYIDTISKRDDKINKILN